MTLLELLAAYGALFVLLLAMWMILRGRQRTQPPAPTPPVQQMGTIRIATPADFRAFLQDPNVPPVVKGIIAQAAHDAGLCGCDVFDRDGQLTETDVAWLHAQRGERS